MAFESIGIGGILTFAAAGAISSMGSAERAFGTLSFAARQFQSGVNNVGLGLGKFHTDLMFINAGMLAASGGAVKLTDEYIRLQNRLRTVAESEENVQQLTRQLIDV